jgi:hypothetical protein
VENESEKSFFICKGGAEDKYKNAESTEQLRLIARETKKRERLSTELVTQYFIHLERLRALAAAI